MEILIGWKEIAGYLKVSEKTAIRYEDERGMPVKRDPAGHPIITVKKIEVWRLQSVATQNDQT